MPRSRLAWRWFAVWSLLVFGLLVVSQWIASVELARLADAMQMERMSERARNLSASLPDDPDGDRAWLEPFGRGTEGGAVEVFDVRGRPIAGGDSTDSDADGKGLDAAMLADALAGRRSTAGRYDAASARRTVSVVSPVVRGGRTTAIIRINGDTTAFMQFLTSDVFRDFPTLKVIIPHGGGAVPYHWGRYRGLAQDMGKPLLKEHLLHNVFFDTCVYHLPGIRLLLEVIPTENILFATEMVGAVKGIDPETGYHYDDTKRYIDQVTTLTQTQRQMIFEGNARRVYPRLNPILDAITARTEGVVHA